MASCICLIVSFFFPLLSRKRWALEKDNDKVGAFVLLTIFVLSFLVTGYLGVRGGVFLLFCVSCNWLVWMDAWIWKLPACSVRCHCRLLCVPETTFYPSNKRWDPRRPRKLIKIICFVVCNLIACPQSSSMFLLSLSGDCQKLHHALHAAHDVTIAQPKSLVEEHHIVNNYYCINSNCSHYPSNPPNPLCIITPEAHPTLQDIFLAIMVY